jgi:hypothetical protein
VEQFLGDCGLAASTRTTFVKDLIPPLWLRARQGRNARQVPEDAFFNEAFAKSCQEKNR